MRAGVVTGMAVARACSWPGRRVASGAGGSAGPLAPPARAWDRHVDRSAVMPAGDSHSAAALRVAQHRAVAAGQYRGRAICLRCSAAGGQPHRRRGGCDAGAPTGRAGRRASRLTPLCDQLLKRDDPVLAGRDPSRRPHPGRVWRVSQPIQSERAPRVPPYFALRAGPRHARIRSAPCPRSPPSAPSSRSPCASSSTRARSRWASSPRRSPRRAARSRAWTWFPAPAARASGCASSRSTPATRRTGRRSCARSAPPAAPGCSTTWTARFRCIAAARSSSRTSTR